MDGSGKLAVLCLLVSRTLWEVGHVGRGGSGVNRGNGRAEVEELELKWEMIVDL